MTQTAAPPAADRPAHYRLGNETWALILKEYREGATAPFLEKKWRVSQHAIRARITKHKSTKRDWGDEQAIGQALAREAELEEARRNSPEAAAARLFDGVALDEAQAGDPAVLMRAATLASGRAMKGRLWTEARALAGLAESYARLADRARGLGAEAAGTEGPEEAEARLEWKRRQLFDRLDAVIQGGAGGGMDARPDVQARWARRRAEAAARREAEDWREKAAALRERDGLGRGWP